MWDTPTEEYGYRPLWFVLPRLAWRLLAPPANANDISTHPQNIIPSNAYLFFLWCIVVDPTQKMVVDVEWKCGEDSEKEKWGRGGKHLALKIAIQE